MTNGLAENLVQGEYIGIIEHWRFDGDCTHILLAIAVTFCGDCKEREPNVPGKGSFGGKSIRPHTWFVNFEGRTRCIDCHHALLEDRARQTRVALGLEPGPALPQADGHS